MKNYKAKTNETDYIRCHNGTPDCVLKFIFHHNSS